MELLKAILSLFYKIGITFRHWLFDAGIRRSEKFDLPVVCVGNITVGGTGKTPMVELIIDRLGSQYCIAVLSRGYKRRTKGYIEVDLRSSYLDVGDEPKQIKRHLPQTVVVVCEDRNEGIRRIRSEHPEVTMIVMDDGFQHRTVHPKVNIVITDYTRPVDRDHYLPWGTLRDTPSQLIRANILVINKTPDTMSPIERNIALKSLRLYPFQSAFFTAIRPEPLEPLYADEAIDCSGVKKAIVMAGVGNPKPFVAALGRDYEIVETMLFNDHHIYKVREINRLERELKVLGNDVIVITTCKDGVKLTGRKHIPALVRQRLFVQPISLTFRDGDENKFIQTLLNDVNNED